MASPFPSPTSPLGYLRVLSPTAGVKVSPLCLGTWSLGSKWSAFAGGGVAKDEAFKYLDVYRDAGGNFIDTANMYQNGETEQLIGEWLEARGCRDEIVLASKYSYCYHPQAAYTQGQLNFQGNNAKSMHLSLTNSLRRLKTSYLDIFYVHFWDYTTSIPEIMTALHALVTSGQVYYLGISDTPAWIVAKANEYARSHNLTSFSVYQGQYSLLLRDVEAEILPMVRAEGMAFAAYGVTGSGKFKTASEIEAREKAGTFRFGQAPTPTERAVSAALEKVGEELPGKPSPASVAQVWAASKQAYIIPLAGGSSPDHLVANIKALELSLCKEQVQTLESVQPWSPPWPMANFGTDPAATESGTQDSFFAMMPNIEFVRIPKALGPPARI